MNAFESELHKHQQQKTQVENDRDRATFLKDSLQKQHDALKIQLGQSTKFQLFNASNRYGVLDNLKEKNEQFSREHKELSEKLERIGKENDELETENKDVLLKYNHTVASLRKAEDEISKRVDDYEGQ